MFAGMLSVFILIILYLLLLLQTPSSYAQQSNTTARIEPPSSCGNIRNISYPFRLGGDPQLYRESRFALACENGTSLFLYLNFPRFNDHYYYRYHVESINYNNYTIRVVDASIIITNDTCSSYPEYPVTSMLSRVYHFYYNNYVDYPYWDQPFTFNSSIYNSSIIIAQPITFITCIAPQNKPFYTRADRGCGNSGTENNGTRYTYITVDHSMASDLGDTCRTYAEALTSMPHLLSHGEHYSLSEMHSFLRYGFEISWSPIICRDQCGERQQCEYWDANTRPICPFPAGSTWTYTDCYFNNVICIGYRRFIANHIIVGGPFNLFMFILHEVLGELDLYQAPLMWIIGSMITIKHGIGVLLIMGLLTYKLRTRHLSNFNLIEGFLHDHKNLVPIRYSYSDIKKMTRGFREQLGQGGFGSVYKGKLRSGYHVAVKKLIIKSGSNGQDFMNEVATIGRTHHVNVVRLVGYCAEGNKRALIYDFMPNGSLEKYLKPETTRTLSWEKKYEIAIGVARGIEYLHRGCDIQILHFDIKPHNILLDENFTPKVADFGLAKFHSPDHNTVTLTARRGTVGYCAPEVNNGTIGKVSYKSDVYSFGMLLAVMAGLKPGSEEGNGDNSSRYFPQCIYSHLNKWKDIEAGIVDIDERVKRKMSIVVLWCTQMYPVNRPSMSKVIEMLEGEVESLQIPPKPPKRSETVAQTWESIGSSWGTEMDESNPSRLKSN